jgi:hypothetical protein
MSHHRPAPQDTRPAEPDAPGDSPSRQEPSSMLAQRGLAGDQGMTTAEYAVGTVAACGFGAVLYKAVTSDAVARLLRGVLEQALSVGFL